MHYRQCVKRPLKAFNLGIELNPMISHETPFACQVGIKLALTEWLIQ